MKMILTVISSLFLILSCSSVRTFELTGVSGGNIQKNAILIEDDILRIKLENYENTYDLMAFRLTIMNKSSNYLKIDRDKFYLKDLEAGVFYPLNTDQAFNVVKSHKVFETPLEEMKTRRKMAIAILKSGELPPASLVVGTLFFEPGFSRIKEVSLVLRGLSLDGRVLDFQDVVFQDDSYSHQLRKIKANKMREEKIQMEARIKEEKAKKEAEEAKRLKNIEETEKLNKEDNSDIEVQAREVNAPAEN